MSTLNAYLYNIDYTMKYYWNKSYYKHTIKEQKYTKCIFIVINMAYFSLFCFLPFYSIKEWVNNFNIKFNWCYVVEVLYFIVERYSAKKVKVFHKHVQSFYFSVAIMDVFLAKKDLDINSEYYVIPCTLVSTIIMKNFH